VEKVSLTFMRLFEAIIDANHRAVAGDVSAGLHPADFADAMPVIALTCIDPRLNAFFPNALALPAGEFIWLRNAGNIITGPLSSTMRSLALACAVKGGREIAILGHTDCQVCRTTTTVLLDKLKALGVERSRLPDNVNEFFGMFGSERQNVVKACEFARSSPLVGPKIPVHGLMIDVETGKLDWVVNGYETVQTPMQSPMPKTGFATMAELGAFKDFELGEMKFPEMKIGDAALPGKPVETNVYPATAPALAPSAPPPLPKTPLPPVRRAVPPPIKPNPNFTGWRR
jgi:carbonic anhydrase